MRFCSIVCCLLLNTGLFAQDSLTLDMLVPDKAIKVSPLHILNFYPTVEVSYEQKIFTRVTLQAELGYVLNFRVNNSEEFQNKRGVKVKLESRYYFWGRTDRQKMYYLSAEPYMNVINFDRTDRRQECFDIECNSLYVKEYNYKTEYRESGFSIKAGMITYVDDFFFDFNSGFTLRNIRYHEPDWLVRGFDEFESQLFEIPNEKDRVTFAPYLCARIGYRLK